MSTHPGKLSVAVCALLFAAADAAFAQSNPLYNPNETALQMLGEAIGVLPIGPNGSLIPYLSMANAAGNGQPVTAPTSNGTVETISGTPWQNLSLFSNLPPDVQKYYEASGLRATLYDVNGTHVLAFAASEPLENIVNNYSQVAKDWIQTDIGRDVGYNSAIGNKLWNFALGTNLNWKNYQSDQTVASLFIAEKLLQKYPNLQVTGFSLGGNHADYVGALLKIPAVAFEPTAVHFAAGQLPETTSVLNFTIQGNVADFTGKPFGNTISFDPKLIGEHSPFQTNSITDAPDPITLHDLGKFKTLYTNMMGNIAPTTAVSNTGQEGTEIRVTPSTSAESNPWSKVGSSGARLPPPFGARQLNGGPASSGATAPKGGPAVIGSAVNPPIGNLAAGHAGRIEPGGISLSKAAAERMPLAFTVDGAYIADDKLVLSGATDAHGMDAALFFTAIRAACGQEDPYFSLDPQNGAAWLAEGRSASEQLWDRIQGGFKSKLTRRDLRDKRDAIEFRTVWARRDYPAIWNSILPRYPDLKSKLVFRPEWLRDTRFGEIMYRADVLLKELDYGVPLLDADNLRAHLIPGYTSAANRDSAMGLIKAVEDFSAQSANAWHGVRLWFDLVPERVSADSGGDWNPSNQPSAPGAGPPVPHSERGIALQRLLRTRGLVDRPPQESENINLISESNNSIDLSQVFPKMFVRRHDEATGRDLPGHDPALDMLAEDVNSRPRRYVEAYKELADLSQIFRAYIIAVQLTERTPELCDRIRSIPLLDSEKVAAPLSLYHPSELFITYAWYEYSEGRGRRLVSSRGFGVSGGVAIAGHSLLQIGISPKTTAVTQAIGNAIATLDGDRDSWKSEDRRFLLFDVLKNLPAGTRRVASNSPITGGAGQDEIENAPPPQQLPATTVWGANDRNVTLLFVGLLIAGAFLVARPKRRRR